MASKKPNTSKQKEIAYALYMNNISQGEIAEKVDVSRQTINKWIKDGSWAERRAAKNITRPELTNKMLSVIADDMERLSENSALNEEEDVDEHTTMTEAEIKAKAKLAALKESSKRATIKNLKEMAGIIKTIGEKTSVVDAIEVLLDVGKWLQYRATIDPELTPELIKDITKFQDLYISDRLGNKSKN